MKHSEIDNLPGGVLAIKKAAGMTSHDVVNKIRRLYNTKRVGHAGTLDPMATGVLVVLVGRAAKACETRFPCLSRFITMAGIRCL